MATTYEKIATATGTGSSGTITFSSIPSTYTDLRVISNYSLTGGSANFLRFNNDSSALYSETNLDGDGASAGSSNRVDQTAIILLSASTDRAFHALDIFSYTGSTFKTTLVSQSLDRSGAGIVRRTVGLYRSTSAITRLDFVLGNPESFTTSSTFTLYGILKA
jgi:hypothetical protein